MAKRGRPPAFDADTIEYAMKIKRHQTRRSTINDLYGYEAVGVLLGIEGLEFILDDGKVSGKKVAKQCILVELGRLGRLTGNPEDIKFVARHICEMDAEGDKRTAHEWAAEVRRIRLNLQKRLKEPGTDIQQQEG